MNEKLRAAFEAVRKLPKWIPSAKHIAEIKAGGRITEAARWDCANYETRCAMRPDLNPHKRWYEQRAFDKPPEQC